MPVRAVPTPNAPPVAGPYSPAVAAGDWFCLSGQVGLDPETGALATGGVEGQTRQVFANIAAVLGDCGVTLRDVAKTTVFLTDMGEFAAMNEVFAELFAGHKPARTTIGVASLPIGAAVEIEVWVYRPIAERG